MATPRSRRLSKSDIEKMKPTELKKALNESVTELKALDRQSLEDNQSTAALQATLDELRQEMRLNREERAQAQKELSVLRSVVNQQQAFIEYLDSQHRQCNVIITGVKENEELDGASTDKEKCDKILSKLKVSEIKPVEIKRLGKPEAGRNRPLLVKVSSKSDRDKVVYDTKVLKKAGKSYEKVYVRKDVHPATRKEWKRLYDQEKAEKEKPENQGVKIELDRKSRELRRNGVVIDRWNPAYFQ